MNVNELAYLMKTWTQHREMDYLAAFQALPALRAVWGMSAVGASGQALDLGPLALHLTRNGTLQYDYDGLLHYAVLNGSTDYLSRASEAALNITGTESYIANPGLTLGGWFWFNAVGSVEIIMSKYLTTADQRSFRLLKDSNDDTLFQVSSDGTSGATVTATLNSVSITATTWWFIAARFDPSTEMKVWLNNTTATNTTSIPASVYSGSADFNIGSLGPNLLNGRAGPGFLCAAAASDAQVRAVYQRTRPIVDV